MLVNVGKLMSHTSTKGGGGVKHPFNPSLVDAWFMSGLSNNDKPSSIRGVKGNEVVLKTLHLHQKADLEKEITRVDWYSTEWMITVYVLGFLS